MARKSSPIRSLMSPTKIIIPIAIGLAVAGYFLYTEIMAATSGEGNGFQELSFGWQTAVWLFVALLMVATRDLGYMYRIRVLTDYKISWRNSFDVIMLWEFASAISPSIVGGSGVALFIVNKEGISLGRSTAVVMITAFLDELFYILMVPLVLFVVGTELLFPVNLQKEILGLTLGTQEIFYFGYGFIVVLTSIILTAIFFAPQGFKRMLSSITSIKVLRRWRRQAIETGNEIILTSKELRGKPFGFWAKAFGATLFSWTARFWVVNFLIMALSAVSFGDHLMIYARQLVMWVIMLISPTPGGAGIAELAFEGFLSEYVVFGLAGTMALLWRIFTYYPYLFVGAVVLPRWVRRVYLGRRLIKFKEVG